MLLVDRSPVRLLRAARVLMDLLKSSRYALDIRLGGHCGHWSIESRDRGSFEAAISEIIATAARIEPLTLPGHIFVTERFLQEAKARWNIYDEYQVSEVDGEFCKHLSFSADGKVNIAKSGKEPDEWVRLFCIDDKQ